MESETRHLPWLRIGMITSILYSITIIIYMMFYYNTIKNNWIVDNSFNDPLIADVNETIKSINRQNIIFFFIFAFIICLAFSIFALIIYEEIVFLTKPIIAVNAKLKIKECETKIGGRFIDPRVGYSASNAYRLTFETDNGSEIKFPVGPKQYMFICEGNKGILMYKQAACKRFVSFDIQEIS